MIINDIGPGLSVLGFDARTERRLRKQGIVTCAQVFDLLRKPENRSLVERIVRPSGLDRTILASRAGARLPVGICRTLAASRFELPALTGIAGPGHTSDIIRERRAATRDERKLIARTLRESVAEESLPTRSLLVDYMSPVRDQMNLGSCTGWGSTGNREMLVQRMLSPLFAYLLAKELDGRPDLEGSWQHFCFEGFSRFGHLRESDFPYTDRPGEFDLECHLTAAAEFRISGFVDLMPEPEDYDVLPILMKQILSGRLSDDLGPQALSVSLAVGRNWYDAVANEYGLFRVEDEGFELLGGHAMTVAGYIDGDDPDGLYDTDYFVIKNSWGTEWARKNPLGLPGYGLFPAQYFMRGDLIWEALLCIAEPSPADRALGILEKLRMGWDTDAMALPAACRNF